MRTPAKTGLIVATLIGALTLTACGEATVEDDSPATTSVAPLERSPRTSETTSSTEASESEASESESTSASVEPAPRAPAAPQPQDQGAREVDEVPAQEVPRSPEDLAFLGELSGNGVDVVGVEDQMIGTATTVCQPGGTGIDKATVPAVAGQLVEQGRTDRPAEEIAQLIENAARKAYC